MNIYNAEQIKAWDAYTIAHEPIASVDLMERAAQRCVEWILQQQLQSKIFKIFCGKGNNGGDGLAIARLLIEQGIAVNVYILEFGRLGSDDFQTNLQRLHETPCEIHFIQTADNFPVIFSQDIVVDALFGSGLNKPLQDLSAKLVNHLNSSKATIISIDIPSGLYIDKSSAGNPIIKAHFTLTFQCYKEALLVAENAIYFGEVHVLPIGLHPDFITANLSSAYFVDELIIKSIFKQRQEFTHKGTYGHALLITGSYGKMGAAILATTSCLRAGAGLVTAYIPKCGYSIMQTSAPEAMAKTDEEENFIAHLPDELERYNTIGVGPGIGTDEKTKNLIKNLVLNYKKPLIIDADGLNCLAAQPEILHQLLPFSVLTPHPKEFERLFGKSENDFERIALAQQKAQSFNIIIVLKGHHTLIALPDGKLYFNSTGNAGMATGGTGDVLTGIITSLIAQGYKPEEAAILGVYLHGLAGDIAAHALSKEAMIASDIITFLSQAFLQLTSIP